MWYFLIIGIVLVLAGALLALRLRVRFEIAGSERRLLFVSLGRSGSEFDFSRKSGTVHLFGRGVKSFEIGKKKSERPDKKVKRDEQKRARAAKKKAEAAKPKRKRSLRAALQVLPQCAKALWTYGIGLIKAAIVEEAEGEIQAGFEQPDITGKMFGYYQAALAAVPSVAGRVRYYPDWSGASFAGSMRVAVAIPLYKLIWRTTVLVVHLPVMKLIKLAIGKKEGVQDGK